MTQGGFVLIHRTLWDHPAFRNGIEAGAFAWMISQASWRPTKVRYKEIVINLERGQLALSGRDFGRKWGWSEASSRRFLNRLKSDAMIDARSDAGVSIITIKNYDVYQIDPARRGDEPEKTDAPSDAASDAEATHPRRTPDAQNNESNKGNEKKEGGDSEKKARRKPETPLPSDWKLPDEWLSDFRKDYPALDIAFQAERFKNHAHANDRRCRDWKAALRNWLLKAKPEQRSGGTRPVAIHDDGWFAQRSMALIKAGYSKDDLASLDVRGMGELEYTALLAKRRTA
jgi:hypothetical protein